MTSLRIIIPFFTLLLLLITSSEAREFRVGGNKSSWGNPWPSVLSLNEWAATNRFRVGDTLKSLIIFEYDPKVDSVLRVTKEDYEICNKKNPIKKYEERMTKIELDQSTPFFFIGGSKGKCRENRQKLIVVVLADEEKVPERHYIPPSNLPNQIAPIVSPTVAPPQQGGAHATMGSGGFMDIPMAPPAQDGGAHGKGGFMGILMGVGVLVGMVLL